MPILAGIVILIQFCFAFHALKTGRPYWWIFVIMAFPVSRLTPTRLGAARVTVGVKPPNS
jgi:hypothetical protein